MFEEVVDEVESAWAESRRAMRGAHPIIRRSITIIIMQVPTENNTPRPARAKTAFQDFTPTTAQELQALKADVAASECWSLAGEKKTGENDPRDQPLRSWALQPSGREAFVLCNSAWWRCSQLTGGRASGWSETDLGSILPSPLPSCMTRTWCWSLSTPVFSLGNGSHLRMYPRKLG